MSIEDRRAVTAERAWVTERNWNTWFYDYALCDRFRNSAAWQNAFRIPLAVFKRLSNRLSTQLTKSTTNFRDPIAGELKLVTFLVYCGGTSNAGVGNQLGLGTRTVYAILNEVFRAISSPFSMRFLFLFLSQMLHTP